MNAYDPKDYAANPSKYQLFKTARVASHVFTENGESDLAHGQYVAVQFFRSAWNQLRRREEPVFSVTANGKVWGMLYASALSDFCL